MSSAGQPTRAQSTGLASPRRSGAELNNLIRRLEQQWQMGLKVRDPSPHKSANDTSDKVYNLLQRFYYHDHFELAIGRFAVRVDPLVSNTQEARKERLRVLHETLLEIDREGPARVGTPGSRGKVGDPAAKVVRAGHTPNLTSGPFTPSKDRRSTARSNNAVSSHENIHDPGSPTDEDEDFNNPASPSPYTRSTHSRPQASYRSRSSSPTKKRPSDSSESGTSSPKLARTHNRKQPSNEPPASGARIPAPQFVKPTLEMARSFQGNISTNLAKQTWSGPVRSFDTSLTGDSFNSLSSSQRTQPDTANTSFSSIYSSDVRYPKLRQMSSTTLDSLDDQALLSAEAEAAAAEAQIKRESEWAERLSQGSQDAPARSSSTFGSYDEIEMVEKSFEVEKSFAESTLPNHSPPKRESTRTPFAKRSHFAPPSAEQSPFNRPQQQSSNGGLDPQGNSTMRGPSTDTEMSRSTLGTSITSPSKLPHYIRDIPEQNLFTEPLPEHLKQFPYFVLFICSRLATEHKVSLPRLLHGVDASSALVDASSFLEHICSNLDISKDALSGYQKFWSASHRDFEGYTFKARIEFQRPQSCYWSGPVFGLNILPLDMQRSCRFQRKFGSDRFLYINVPSFGTEKDTKPRRFTDKDMLNIKMQWKTWYEREHTFLGRKWRAFHYGTIKKKKDASSDDISDKRIVLFATEGIGIEGSTSVGEMRDWFFSFEKNIHQALCKADARVELGLSRTIPAMVFLPSQIRFVKDKLADGTPEDVRFNDDTLEWPTEYPRHAVMNDGCSNISYSAAFKIWNAVKKATNSDEPMPSAFQGRIGPAKGIWIVGQKSACIDPSESDWIEISDSQKKFEPHTEDLSGTLAFDPHRLTFDYVDHSRRPVANNLHISFIPILVDRGVTREVVAELTTNSLDAERNTLTQLLPDPLRMYHWIHREGSSSGSEGPKWRAGMPHSLDQRIKHLFESGFLPNQEPYLASSICSFIRMCQIQHESKFRVPLSKSTYVIGVPDPLGVLAPGEVHMEFSSPFTDELTGVSLRALDGIDILISRQPSCRRSDIQRVRAIKHPELSRLDLCDIVVLPTRGEFPLAGKLQGGDYDGDKFWLCWEQALVQPFRNAPAPVHSPDPAQYRIKQDKRTLAAVVDPADLSTVDNLIREALEFRMTPSLLGMVTSFLEKQAYRENQVFSDRLNGLCDMHDLLVDAEKQGYTLTDADWNTYIRYDLRCGKPRVPAYKQAMDDCEVKKAWDSDKRENARTKDYKHKEENILDYLYFKILRPHNVTTLANVKEQLHKEFGDDPILKYPFLQLRNDDSNVVKQELDSLTQDLKDVEKTWVKHFATGQAILPGQRDRAVGACYEQYCSIIPSQVDHPEIKPWMYPYKRQGDRLWETIRASAFYTLFPTRHTLVWLMAGKQLAELKSASYEGSTTIVPRIKAIMKPKLSKVSRQLEESSDDDEFQTALEDWTGSPNRPLYA